MKKKGFTLAEILITLGIIGIVAAMTIPTLISNYKKKGYSTKIKKFYSLMNQAIQLSTIENGNTISWAYPERSWTGEGMSGSKEELKKFWGIYFAPYIKTMSAESCDYYVSYDGVKHPQQTYTLYFQDGSSLMIRSSDAAVDFHFDVNGKQEPNKSGRDIFQFLIFFKTGKFTPYIYTGLIDEDSEEFTLDMNDRDNILKLCRDLNGAYCSQLLFFDNWEFKDDYPLKL